VTPFGKKVSRTVTAILAPNVWGTNKESGKYVRYQQTISVKSATEEK
jgi:hypothetical protein